jgi:hypothetical protein
MVPFRRNERQVFLGARHRIFREDREEATVAHSFSIAEIRSGYGELLIVLPLRSLIIHKLV